MKYFNKKTAVLEEIAKQAVINPFRNIKILETVKEIFIISEQTGKGCTPFQQLLLDNGDGKKIYLNLLKKKI